MEFCTNCGNQINGEKFCVKCGAPTGAAAAPVQDTPVATPVPPAAQNNLVGIIIAIVVALGIAITGFLLLTSRSSNSTVKKYFKASMNADAKKIVSLMPDALVDYVVEEEFDGDKKEMIEELEDSLEEGIEYLEKMGVNPKKDISFEIVDEDEIDEDEIEEINKEYKEAKLKVKKGKRVEVEMTVSIDGEEETTTQTIDVVKIGRSWYLIDAM